MLQQVERLHACDAAPAPQPSVRRKAAIEEFYADAPRPSKRACGGGDPALYAGGVVALQPCVNRQVVRGYECAPTPPDPAQAAGACRTWEVMHDIARGPEGHWHTEFLNDLAGLLGHEGAPEARPAPPELDAESCNGGSGAVCGLGAAAASQPWGHRAGLAWQSPAAYEHNSMGMCEGMGEN